MTKTKEDSIRNRVTGIVKGQPGTKFCNKCLLKLLGTGSHTLVAGVTRSLVRGGVVLGFEQCWATCDICGEKRRVIYAIDATPVGWNALS